MGWSWRKKIKIGPLNLNFSRSGLGVSFGVPGARIGRDAKGNTYTSVGLPGTGLSKREVIKKAAKQKQW